MIVARAPLRISFVGGGTDLKDFYSQRPGRVVSATIDKFVYVAVNRTPMIDKVSVRYSVTETVDHAKDLEHTRVRAALVDAGIDHGIEIASFASVPAKTGLGSSSSFSTALLKALSAYRGNKMSAREIAEGASRLEIDLIGEPIGKQDQYAAAFGGFNVFQFNPDGSVDVSPVLLGYEKRMALEANMVVFFTGITRAASSVLTEQKANIQQADKFSVLSEMADSVDKFVEFLVAGNVSEMGKMLHEGWMRKKSLTSKTSSPSIDALYEAGLSAGAWGGKLLGAGGGGCLLFLVPPERQADFRKTVQAVAVREQLEGFKELPVNFVQSGTEVLFNADY